VSYYTVEGLRPPIITRGVAQTRHLHVYVDAATSETGYAGTYSLYAPDGTVVSGASAITVTSSVTASFTPSSTITPGSAYVEVWTLSVGGVTRVWRIGAIVTTWTLADDELLVAPIHVAGAYQGLDEYPAGVTSWLVPCVTASGMTLTDYARVVSLRGVQTVDRAELMLLALHKALEIIFRMQMRNGSQAAAALAAHHAAEYMDGWSNMRINVDTDADGAPDTVTRPLDQPGFSPAPPLG